MAPLTNSNFPDLRLSSLELDRRTLSVSLPDYLSKLSLSERESLNSPPESFSTKTLAKRTLPASEEASSPFEVHKLLTARDVPTQPIQHGPQIDPNHINNNAFFALFAILGVAMIIASIWFFFWAPNGGFRFRKGDWDEYKSTVLRRKGPNGTTLSGATESTNLGGGSVVARGYRDDDIESSIGMSEVASSTAPILVEKKTAKGKNNKTKSKEKAGKAKDKYTQMPKKMKEKVDKKKETRRAQRSERWEGGHDDDVRAYRHEKVATVGGINRESEAQLGTEYSESTDWATRSAPSTYLNSDSGHPQEEQPRRTNKERSSRYGEHAFKYNPREHQNQQRSSPRKYNGTARRESGYTEPIDFSTEYLGSTADTTSETGTKSYHHPIPGLSRPPKAAAAAGFRRGGGRGRRDSLSESDG